MVFGARSMDHAAAILWAARDGDHPEVQTLVGQRPDLVRVSDEHLKTPLHWAAERDHDRVAEALIAAGADIEATTSWGATPLDWAATMGSTKVADVLLAHGARGMNLVTAAGLGKLDLVRGFLESDAPLASLGRRPMPIAADEHWVADSAAIKGDVISDAFYAACRNGHTGVAAVLRQHGADIDAKGVFGGSALHWAAINGHTRTVAWLISQGADRTLTDHQFASTPEGWAAEGRHDDIRDLLRRA